LNQTQHTKTRIAPKRTVKITALDKKGSGRGTTDTGGTLTVPLTIPGEEVEAEKYHRNGRLLDVLTPSPHRIEPACKHFGQCGGCAWQHIDYSHQLRLKQEAVCNRFHSNMIDIDLTSLPIVASPPFGYRNRMDFVWWYDGRFGLRERGKWYSVVDLEACLLLPKPVMDVAFEVNHRVHEANLPFHDTKHKKPGLRYLVIRRGVFTGDLLLSFVTDPMDLPPTLWEDLEGVTSVYQLINDNMENDMSDGTPTLMWGEPNFRETISERLFHAGPRSFFQPNPAVAEKMVEYVKNELLGQCDSLVDLYCGIGLFSVSLADQVRQITGIECNQEAIDWAKINGQGTQAEFICTDAETWNPADLSQHQTLIADPPRTGLHPKVCQTLIDHPFEEIIYVSCNPRCGVEDIARLGETYSLRSLKLFDQFPQTPHVEAIAHLVRK